MTTTTAPTATTFTVADLARAAGIDPKRARARLRKAYAENGASLPQPIAAGVWAFDIAHEDTVLALISK